MSQFHQSDHLPLLWRGEEMEKNKQRIIQGRFAYMPAYQKLLHDADKALTVGPFSVLDKSMVAPSGNKQDYYSVGPYWWPDPESADGLPYIRRDGEVNPEREQYDASARSQMENHVITLALAWFFSNNERYADHAIALLRTWFLDPLTRMHPHLEYGQAIPGICDGRGIGIIETHNFPMLLDAVRLLGNSTGRHHEEERGLKQWFQAYLDWLLKSKHGRDEALEHNNHGTWYDVQVAAFALFVGDRSSAYHALSQNTPERIVTQIEPDGSQPHELARTRSLSYSVMNLLGLMDAADLGNHIGIDLWHFATDDGRGIRSAANYLISHALEQPWTKAQITPASPTMILPILYRAALTYHDHTYLDKIAQLPTAHTSERAHLLYAA